MASHKISRVLRAHLNEDDESIIDEVECACGKDGTPEQISQHILQMSTGESGMETVRLSS
jgi:hypothetical protein